MEESSQYEAKGALTIDNKDSLAKLVIDPNELHSLFNLLNGKPDSTTRIFPRDVVIGRDDLFVLKDKMREKLKQYEITTLIESISVRFEKNKFEEFSNWYQFEDYNWTSSNCIDNMVLKWDFMINFKEYRCPQRHTVVVRLSSGMRPDQILQMLLNGKIEDLDSIDKNLAPVICDVTFVNHLIGDEIINIVEEWNKGLKQGSSINNKYKYFRRHKLAVANGIQNITKVTGLGAIIGAVNLYISNFNVKNVFQIRIDQIQGLIIVGAIGFVLYGILKQIGYQLGKSIIESLDDYGEVFTFNITKGDCNKQEELLNENNKYVKNINTGLAISIIVNIICSIVASILYNKIFLG
ncbi:hypothetical protein JHL18_13595 [Clostridium sp. YIM B02505]|uniref:Uncharacterized protein n=1 Tax=Clostridium yunnanense TaxID=2800325 RepID=A0ABS1EQK6_9CLOT|nr:hypothetical protein [Clostridium yunnanense]MBK1811652.1 hypothetical protein [Clostridium yunnanense]